MSDRNFEVAAISAALGQQLVELVAHFRGMPNPALSGRNHTRWGRKGSFVIDRARRRAPRWDDYEAGTGGDGLDFIQVELGCSLPDALRWAADWLGGDFRPQVALPRARPTAPVAVSDERRARALAIWTEAVNPIGTLVETYLASRGLVISDNIAGRVLRFHPACPWKGVDGALTRLPAMVAALSDIISNEIIGVHRTALTPDGRKIDRRMLGHASGAVIRLSDDGDVTMGLGLVEGIENGMTVLAQGWRPVWACGSAGAIARFPVLAGIETLTIFGDHDQAGQAAARTVANTYTAAGRECVVRLPRTADRDWNDLLQGRAA